MSESGEILERTASAAVSSASVKASLPVCGIFGRRSAEDLVDDGRCGDPALLLLLSWWLLLLAAAAAAAA